MEFEEERDVLTVSVEGTTTSEGWHVRTKWDPASVRYAGNVLAGKLCIADKLLKMSYHYHINLA